MLATQHALLMFLQSPEDLAHDTHMMMIAIWVIAGVMLLVVLAMAVAGLMALRLVKKVEAIADTVEHKALPLIAKSHALLDEVTPKVKTVVAKSEALVDEMTPKIRAMVATAEQIAETAKIKSEELGHTVSHISETVNDVNLKTRVQVNRVNTLVTGILDTTHQVANTVQTGVMTPVRHAAALVAGVRASVESLMNRYPGTIKGNSTRTRGPYDF
ncbi:MAG TPA: hypothetical protein VM865_01520 [Acidobacteriaceae bacterium]|nr:hypothetical protein [Acidobacteriaceae bacterium]